MIDFGLASSANGIKISNKPFVKAASICVKSNLGAILYLKSNDFLDKALLHFTNTDFRNWLDQIGIPTYVGSSKRVYPKEGIKPIEVLSAILKHLKEKGVIIKYEHTFSDWDNHNNPIINNISLQTDYTIFSLGGGSWKVTGSDGSWLDTFSKKGIKAAATDTNCFGETST